MILVLSPRVRHRREVDLVALRRLRLGHLVELDVLGFGAGLLHFRVFDDQRLELSGTPELWANAFRDRQNTAYFVDPANAGIALTVAGRVGLGMPSPTFPLQMGSGAHVTAGGVWTNASSREYKEDIHDLSGREARAALEQLRPKRFHYKADRGDEHLGFIAEEVPDLVATANRKGLSAMDVVAVLTKVVQEQQAELEQVRDEIRRLSSPAPARGGSEDSGVVGGANRVYVDGTQIH